MKTTPAPNAGSAEEIAKDRDLIAKRGLTGAANNTKWSILLDAMRSRNEWIPSYRYGVINGYISDWDVEWWYHVPLPMLCVEWFDIGLIQVVNNGLLIDPEIIDHSSWIIPLLDSARFDYEISDDIVRIFGYLPRNRTKLTKNG